MYNAERQKLHLLSAMGATRGETGLFTKLSGDILTAAKGDGERLNALFNFSNEGDVLFGGFGSKCSGRPLT